MSGYKLLVKSDYITRFSYDGIKEAIENRWSRRIRCRLRAISKSTLVHIVHRRCGGISHREIHQVETNGGRMVAQMKFRDFHRTLFLFVLCLSLRDLFLLFRWLLLFPPVDRSRPRQRRAFPVGEARSTLRRRIFKARGKLTLYPALPLSPSRGRNAGGGWQCGLFAEKSHSVGRAAAARITLFARGRTRVGCCEGRRRDGIRRGRAKSTEHTRAELRQTSSGQPPIFFSSPLPLLLIALEKAPLALWKCCLFHPPLTFIGRGRVISVCIRALTKCTVTHIS